MDEEATSQPLRSSEILLPGTSKGTIVSRGHASKTAMHRASMESMTRIISFALFRSRGIDREREVLGVFLGHSGTTINNDSRWSLITGR